MDIHHAMIAANYIHSIVLLPKFSACLVQRNPLSSARKEKKNVAYVLVLLNTVVNIQDSLNVLLIGAFNMMAGVWQS
jgi:hypothetical protein